MADWLRKIETTHRVVYTLHSPTNSTEIAKVLTAIDNDELLDERLKSWDDSVTVTASEAAIEFSFPIDEPPGRTGDSSPS
jgi:hypothetical protein